jgi:F-box/leucine-rich repeat protein 10/11
MAKARRRSARNKTVESSEEKLEAVVDTADSRPDEEVDKCPACKNEDSELWNAADKENWVQCDACKAWYHWRCVGNGGDLESIDKWYAVLFLHQVCLRHVFSGTVKTV